MVMIKVLVYYAETLKLEYSISFVDAHIKDTVDDTRASEYLRQGCLRFTFSAFSLPRYVEDRRSALYSLEF